MALIYSDYEIRNPITGGGDSYPSYNQSSIGAKLSVSISLIITGNDQSLTDSSVWFNPGLFLDIGTPWIPNNGLPSKGWFYQFQGNQANGTYPMVLVGMGQNSAVNKNIEVSIRKASSTSFQIILDFFLTSDVDNFLSGALLQNVKRFLNNSNTANTQLDNSAPSVYNYQKELVLYVVLDNAADSTISPFTLRTPFNARFYDSGLMGASSEVSNMQISLQRSGAPVTDLSAYEDTVVLFSGTRANDFCYGCYVHVFKVSNVSNTLDFVTAYDMSSALVPTNPNSAQIDSAIYSPSQEPQDTGGGNYEGFFTIESQELQANQNYRIVVVWYFSETEGDLTGIYSNSTISPLYGVAAFPPAREFEASGPIGNYLRNLGDYVEIAPVERAICRVEVDKIVYNDSAAQLPGGPFTDFETDVRNIKLEIIDGVSILHTANAFAQDQSGVTVWVSDDQALEIVDAASSMSLSYIQRMLFDNSGIAPSWESKEISFRWTFIATYDDQGQGFSVCYEYTQRLIVNEMDNDTDLEDRIDNIEVLDEATGLPVVGGLCNIENLLIRVSLSSSLSSEPYKLIAYLDQFPYGSQITSDVNLKEEESITPVNGIPQSLVLPIFAADEDFVGGVATFIVSVSQLNDGVQYRVLATAIKNV